MVCIMEESVGSLIKRLRTEKNISQGKLAILSGIDRAYISQLESEKRESSISLKTARALALALGVKAEIFLSDGATPVNLPQKPLHSMFSEFEERFKALEVIEIPIRGTIPAGIPCVVREGNEGFVHVIRESLKNIQDTHKLFALIAQGDSMEGDKIFSGDRILIKPMLEVDVDNKIYACRIDNECTLKRVSMTTEGKYRLHASNDHYKDYEPNKLEIMGRAIKNLGKDADL